MQQPKELDESQFDDDDFKKEPALKKQKVHTLHKTDWMEESDLFHKADNKKDEETDKQDNKINDGVVNGDAEAESE